MAENLVGSEIIKLAGEIKALIAKGEQIDNFTIGDFNPEIFPIPAELNAGIQDMYAKHQTNYPASNGMAELRETVSDYLNERAQLSYSPNEILISGGARPLIYAVYQTLVDPGDEVVFPVPSWNNNHYTHLTRGKSSFIQTTPDTNFMPTAQDLEGKLDNARLLALCSPLNPTGTVFSKDQLLGICELVLEINKHRESKGEKPLYLLYDQIYWQLTFGETRHYDPVSLMPEMRPYTIFIDGISKAFAATGVRIGWAAGPEAIIGKMKSILGHVGAWAPKAEQLACAEYLKNSAAVDQYLGDIKTKISSRLNNFFDGFKKLKSEGFGVDVISPQAAIYLTVKFDLIGKKTTDGKTIETVEDITAFLLKEAGLALVPFYAFGAERTSTWYRLSVGTAQENHPEEVMQNLRTAFQKLS